MTEVRNAGFECGGGQGSANRSRPKGKPSAAVGHRVVDARNYAVGSSPTRLNEDHYVWPLKVVNEMGLHARPASMFVETAGRYRCDVTIRAGNRVVDGKSILQLLSLSAEAGTTLLIETRGSEALAAIQALADLVRRGFGDEATNGAAVDAPKKKERG